MAPRVRGRLLLAASLAVACTDARDITPLAPERTALIPSTATLHAPGIDHFGADVELRITPSGNKKGTRGRATLQRYHIDRTRGSDNVWTSRTTLDHAALRQAGTASGIGSSVSRFPVTIVRRDGDATATFLDAEGREVALPPDLASEKDQLTAWPNRGATTSASRGFDSGAAVDAIVLIPDRKDARLARIRARLGAPAAGRTPGRSLYRAQVRDLTIEAVVDDDVGAIVEETFTQRGKVVAHRRSEVTRLADGTPIVSRMVSEHVLDDTATDRVVVEHAYRNVTVRRGGPGQ